MRTHGVVDYPDPRFVDDDTGVIIDPGGVVDYHSPLVQTATRTCESVFPSTIHIKANRPHPCSLVSVSPAQATRLFALVGMPVAGNPTQEMLEAAFASAGIEARYVSLAVEPTGLRDAIVGVRALGFEGLHVTVPHKVAAVSLVDKLTEAAKVSGAVNCVKRERDLLVGDNTDGRGFLESLRAVVDPRGVFAVVVGAGGAGRAVATELALAGARRLVVVNRSLDRAVAVAAAVRHATGCECVAQELSESWPVPPEAEVVVQATTVG
ncbi:MAG: shikimate dehydrogenase family protein, partial [Nitrososphaerales archaeon]